MNQNLAEIFASLAAPSAELIDEEAKREFWKRVMSEVVLQNRDHLEQMVLKLSHLMPDVRAVVALLAMEISIVRIERASKDFVAMPYLSNAIRTLAEECCDYLTLDGQ